MAAISPAEINELILDFFSSMGLSGITTMQDLRNKVVLVDDCYSPVSPDELLSIAYDNPLKLPPGALTTQITDCDDYAEQLKTAAIIQFRTRFFAGMAAPLPPAVGIVLSQNHAVNLFVEQDALNKNSLWFMDASLSDVQTTNDPAQAMQLIKKLPIKLIQM